MARNGLLIDYEYCTGCGSCEVAGKVWKDIPVGKWCIHVQKEGPWEVEKDVWEYDFLPLPTDMCDLCSERTSKGKDPACVHNCLAAVISYGSIDELAKKMDEKSKQVLFVPKNA